MTEHLTDELLLVSPAGEIHLKSRRTRRRMRDVLRRDLVDALGRAALEAELTDGPGDRFTASTPDPSAVAPVLARVMGVHRVERARVVPVGPLDDLVATVAPLAEPAIAGRRFAVRVRRRGEHGWTTVEAERALGSALLGASAGVDLDHPDVTVRVHVWGERAFLLGERWPGPGGLPLGVHPTLLGLLSGGIDSPVAIWSMMRRGSPVDVVHFVLDCAQSDHALAVAYGLWRTWGAGSRPRAWLVDFRKVAEALQDRVADRDRQVLLKSLMLRAAEALAHEQGHPALVTGDAMGQVSSQTVSNLVAIDRTHSAVVLRPLIGMTKEEITQRARSVGTYELSARAREVCNLATGPVETAARPGRVRRLLEQLPDALVDDALAVHRTVVALPAWEPGLEPVPVVHEAPVDVPFVGAGARPPASGPVALGGPDAVERATALAREGRPVWVVVRPGGARPGPTAGG